MLSILLYRFTKIRAFLEFVSNLAMWRKFIKEIHSKDLQRYEFFIRSKS
jgi:hypothetical protein